MDLKLLVFLSCLVFAADSTGQTDRVTQDVNGDAILPVHLETTLDKSNLTIKWTHHGKPVHSFGSGETDQDSDYTNRTFLFEEEITKGNVSLKLMNVTEKDAGEYTCTVDVKDITNREFNIILEIRIHVTTVINETVILPVHLRTKLDPASISVRWKFGDKYVLFYTNGKPYLHDGDSVFKDRASFFEDKIPEGNISLKLRNVAENETGNYICEFNDNMKRLKKMIVFLVKIDRKLIRGVTTVNPTTPPDEGDSSHPGRIAAIVVGVGVGVGILAGAIAGVRYCRRRRNAAQQTNYTQAPAAEPADAESEENVEMQNLGEQNANQ